LDQEREQQAIARDTEAVKGEIETFRKEWPELDLEEKDLDGLSLTARIMQSGTDKGIREFKTAALDHLHPRLLDIAQQRARNEAVKGITSDRQQGILARSSTPFTGQSTEGDPGKMSKSDRTAAAKAEFQRLISEG
jgi:hypothetical protein